MTTHKKILKHLCSAAHGWINNEFRKKVLNDKAFHKSKSCETLKDGQDVIRERKEKYTEIVRGVIEDCKELIPYKNLKQSIANDVIAEVERVSDIGIDQIKILFDHMTAFEQSHPNSRPKAVLKIFINMMLFANMITVINTDYLSNS